MIYYIHSILYDVYVQYTDQLIIISDSFPILLSADNTAPDFTSGTDQVDVRLNASWSRTLLVVSRAFMNASVRSAAINSDAIFSPEDIPSLKWNNIGNGTYQLDLRSASSLF